MKKQHFHRKPMVIRCTHVVLLTLSLMMMACKGKYVLDEEHSFKRDIWNRFTPETFEVKIADNRDYFNIDFTTSIDTARYRYESLPLTVNIYSPSGEQRMFYAEIPLKENGRWKGASESNYVKVRHRIRSYFSFNAVGTHRIDVGQATSQYDLEGAHSIGVCVERTKLDYNLK